MAAEPEVNIRTVCILGHSYIRRLKEFINASDLRTNLNLDMDSFKVDFRSRGGLTFKRLAHCAEFLRFDAPPDICFIQMGSNDLSLNNPQKVCTDLISYAQYLRDGVGIKTVIVGQLLRRQPWASRDKFNEDVVKVNNLLKEETGKVDGVYFWPHRGFWADLSYLGRDGVHIEGDSRHMKKYMHSIRIAVLQHSR
ncbi:uncharacterized protein LOC134233175 [Saccostrea cucullata]|uniref:uncharacterized protein LOC134233175 n=1 Tax=Saccostrea cuccullata TaxID=36930 RepID=UPI002ED0FBD1